MNKKILSFILVVVMLVGCMGIFAACNDNDEIAIKGIDGFQPVIDHQAKTIDLKVDSFVASVEMSKFKTSKGVALKAYLKEDKSEEAGDTLSFEFGANTFYIEATLKGKSVVYKLTVERAKPSDVVDTNKTLKSIEINQWKDNYMVGDSFSEGVLKVTYEDGTVQALILTADMVSGFTTAKAGSFEVTISVGEVSVKHTITVKEATIPDYSKPTVAELDVDTFVDAICSYAAMFCTLHMVNGRNYQEEYNYCYQYYQANYSYRIRETAKLIAECGVDTDTFNEISSSFTAILLDVGQIITDSNKTDEDDAAIKAVFNKARLERIKNNATKVVEALKAEQLATLLKEKIEAGIVKVDNGYVQMWDYRELLEQAKKDGQTQVVEALEKRINELENAKMYDNGIMDFFTSCDYNSLTHILDNSLNMLNTLLSCDFDALYNATNCIVDIVMSGEAELKNTLSGKGKYSYKELVVHANFIGDMILKVLDSNYSLSLMGQVIAERLDIFGVWEALDKYVIHDTYKALGAFLKEIKASDLADLYMDYNDWIVASNNMVGADIENAKLATLVVRVSQLIGKAISTQGVDSSRVAQGASGWIVSMFLGFAIDENIEIMSDSMLAILKSSADIQDPTKLSAEQVNDIIGNFNKILNPGFTGDILGYGSQDGPYFSNSVISVNKGDDKASVLQSLKDMQSSDFSNKLYKYTYKDGEIISIQAIDPSKITQAVIANMDWSAVGHKYATLTIDGLSYKMRYTVYDTLSANDEYRIGYYVGYASKSLDDVEIGSQINLEDVLDGLCVEYYGAETNLKQVIVYAEDCDNLKLVGMDTSSVGKKVAYVIGDSDFGKQIFPIYYTVVDMENSEIVSYDFSNYKRDYAVNGKFEGYLRAVRANGDSSLIPLDESKLSYDFSTPGLKIVTYTYEGNQYTANVRVYSQSMALDVANVYAEIYDNEKGEEGVIFKRIGISFYVHANITLENVTLDEIKAALKEVDANYDVTLTYLNSKNSSNGFEIKRYVLKITRGEEVVYNYNLNCKVFDLDNQSIDSIDICVYIDATEEVKYFELEIRNNQGYMFTIYVRAIDELSKYGELSKVDYYGYTFTSPYCENCHVYLYA